MKPLSLQIMRKPSRLHSRILLQTLLPPPLAPLRRKIRILILSTLQDVSFSSLLSTILMQLSLLPIL